MKVPLPFVPAGNVIQEFRFEIVQSQPVSVVSTTLFVTAVGPCVRVVTESAKVQAAASCVMSKRCPATMIEPARLTAMGLAATV